MGIEGTYAYAAPMPDAPFIPAPRPQIHWHHQVTDPVVAAALSKLQADVTELLQISKAVLLAAESMLHAMGEEDVKAGRVRAVPDSITEELFVKRAQLAFQDVRRQLDRLTKRRTTKGARKR